MPTTLLRSTDETGVATASPIIRLDSTLPGETGHAWMRPLSEAGLVLRCESLRKATLSDAAGRLLRRFTSALDALAWLETDVGSARGDGNDFRWVGYLSYDLGRAFEELPCRFTEPAPWPCFVFTRHRLAENAEEKHRPATPPPTAGDVRSNFTRKNYTAAVQRAIDYIAAGDIFQVNLSQRFSIRTRDSASAIYARFLERFPAWYGALLDYGDHALICNSPELFIHVIPSKSGERRILTRPIKGTRPRHPGMLEELRESIKDQAELNMIIDLERNDLGRVCQIGSVTVSQPRMIEAHPTVYHGAATVEGVLRPDIGLVELLRAVFPGGSITGAPKIRAMQIIEELEPAHRGPYCGAIGYLDSSGGMLFNVAIRTLMLRGGQVEVPVGGGIVADSDPDAEYEETLVKAKAALTVLGVERQA